MQAEKLSQKTYRQAGCSGRFVGRKITVKQTTMKSIDNFENKRLANY